jgi:hypothetical protein
VNALRAVTVWMALLAPLAASAGQRPFIYAYDTNIVSTGNIELEQWMWIEGPTHAPASPPGYWVWWGPVVGVTPHLEVAVPFLVNSTAGITWLSSLEPDVRIRLFPQDDRDGFQALLRAAWHEAIANNEQYPGAGASRFDFNLSASYGNASELHALLELGAQIPVTHLAPDTYLTGTYDAGLAYPVFRSLPALQVGAEAFGQLFFQWQGSKTYPPNHWLGATLAWSGGRYWATLGLLVSLTSMNHTPEYLTRLVWAVAL